MGGFKKGESMTCEDCIYLKITRGSRNKYGIQLEPDDTECVGNCTEEEIDKYYSDAEEHAEECSGFRSRHKEEWE